MKKIIIITLLLMSAVVCYAGDKEDYQKEKQEVIERIAQCDAQIAEWGKVKQNNKYRLGQLNALLGYIDILEKREAEKKSKKKKKAKKKDKKKGKKNE